MHTKLSAPVVIALLFAGCPSPADVEAGEGEGDIGEGEGDVGEGEGEGEGDVVDHVDLVVVNTDDVLDAIEVITAARGAFDVAAVARGADGGVVDADCHVDVDGDGGFVVDEGDTVHVNVPTVAATAVTLTGSCGAPTAVSELRPLAIEVLPTTVQDAGTFAVDEGCGGPPVSAARHHGRLRRPHRRCGGLLAPRALWAP